MLDIIADAFPRLIEALRRQGRSRADAAGLILAAKYGERAVAWCSEDCGRARQIVAAAFVNRPRRVRLQMEG